MTVFNYLKRNISLLFAFSIFSFFCVSAFPQDNKDAEILSSKDFPCLTAIKYTAPRGDEKIKKANELFSQYQKDIERQNRLKRIPVEKQTEKDMPDSLFYTYEVRQEKDNYLSSFTGLAARLQLSQGTLATVNSISSLEIEEGKVLILPVNQGLFIAKNPVSSFEILLKNEYLPFISEDDENPVKRFIIDGKEFYFLEGKNFSQTDIAFFHDDAMQLPLDKKILTSPFGYRTSPISGKWSFHAGIDLASPIGTEVHACKTGVITETGFNEIYGNFIRITHKGKTTSLYAHLSKILVKQGESVSTGKTIGLVGTTGASTGPHLHFELREDGKPSDPSNLLK